MGRGKEQTNMYFGTETWSPHVGCLFNCAYCAPSFQQQVKRWGKKNCAFCYEYKPHQHPERLKRIPSKRNVFVAGDGDISFCPPEFTMRIIDRIKEHNKRRGDKTYYFQSKRPEYFGQFLSFFPNNVILLTTLETNRNDICEHVSKAPPPSARFRQFVELDYPRKALTVEPIMAFDLDELVEWVGQIKPEHVWVGYNSKPSRVKLPEPSLEETKKLIKRLGEFCEVRCKKLRREPSA